MPIVERIDPALVPEVFWRDVSSRLPVGNPRMLEDYSPSQLITRLAWYDREVAAALFEPSRLAMDSAGDDLAACEHEFLAWSLFDPRAAVARLEKTAHRSQASEQCDHARLAVAESLAQIPTTAGARSGRRLGHHSGRNETRFLRADGLLIIVNLTHDLIRTAWLLALAGVTPTVPTIPIRNHPPRAPRLAICDARPGDPFEHAPFRALVLSREKPEELIEKVAYRGEPARRRYARIRFGSPSSTRVTVVVDTAALGEVDFYADADRNLKIDDRDRVAVASSDDRSAPRADLAAATGRGA